MFPEEHSLLGIGRSKLHGTASGTVGDSRITYSLHGAESFLRS